MKIAVLFGGCSSEYGVSLQSAYDAVMEELKKLEYEVFPIGITNYGEWYLYTGDWKRIPEDAWQGTACIPAYISPSRDTHGILILPENGSVQTKPSMWYFRYCMAKTEKMVRYRAYVNWQGFRLSAAVR